MKREQIDYSEIDSGIRDLVSILNEIPFVRTQSSCEGHLRDYSGWTNIHPDQSHKFLNSGTMIFRVDRRYKLANELIREIRELESKYPFVELTKHHCDEPGCSIEGSQVLDLDYSDLTHPELINGKDDLEQMVKKRHQVQTEVGERRVAEYKQVWSDFLVMAKRYVELTKTPQPPSLK